MWAREFRVQCRADGVASWVCGLARDPRPLALRPPPPRDRRPQLQWPRAGPDAARRAAANRATLQAWMLGLDPGKQLCLRKQQAHPAGTLTSSNADPNRPACLLFARPIPALRTPPAHPPTPLLASLQWCLLGQAPSNWCSRCCLLWRTWPRRLCAPSAATSTRPTSRRPSGKRGAACVHVRVLGTRRGVGGDAGWHRSSTAPCTAPRTRLERGRPSPPLVACHLPEPPYPAAW